MGLTRVSAMLVCVLAGGLASARAGAQPSPDAVFTAEQAAAGQKHYSAHCASCHAPDLGGRDDAPALVGAAFMATWGAQTTRDLYEFVSSTMPPDGASLTDADYLAVVAHMLQQNGGRPGTAALGADTAARVDAVTKRK